MKKYFILPLMTLSLCALAQEKPTQEIPKPEAPKAEAPKPEKPKWYDEVKLYGFIQGNMIYVTNSVYSWANTTNNYLSSPQFAGVDTIGYPALGFTAQHSRLGFDISKGTDIKVGGKLETDFYSGQHDVNVRMRTRLAYAFLSKGGFEIRVGQQWDLFSPLNPTTNNTNANMWYTGNMGFRRPQIQLMYKKTISKVTPVIQISAGEATREDWLTSAALGDDNKSGIPLLQGRLSAKTEKKYEIGMYFLNASYKKRFASNITKRLDSIHEFSTKGFGVDINIPLHKYFELKGEVNSGTNLCNANLFGISGSTKLEVPGKYVNKVKDTGYVDKKDIGMWFNITSKISDHFQIVIGYGMDKNKTKEKYLAVNDVTSNTTIYGDLVFPISNGFSLMLEIQNIATKIVSQMDITTKPAEPTIKKEITNHATIINLAGKITF